jgi:outer membrane protein OmpA-like peptidoglycan-associated protein
MIVENVVSEVPAIRAIGHFKNDKGPGKGQLLFHSNVNSPLMIESIIQFSWEKEALRERIVRVSAGASMKSAMAQSLATLRKYDVYGLYLEFDNAKLLPESAQLMKDIAVTLKSNPTWTLQILGHTDSIGDAAYNLKLSADRAQAVAANLTQQGIASARLTTTVLAEARPKSDNGTIEGRAVNRRVELVRTDR